MSTPIVNAYTPTQIQISELTKYVRLPNDWRMHFQQGHFISATPSKHRLASHGFKIRFNFLPSRIADAIEALQITSEVCTQFKTPVKFIPSLHRCQLACEKRYPVEGAGKLITIYTDSNAVFESVCRALNDRISTTSILPAACPISDSQVTAHISFRYGSFTEETHLTGPDGNRFEDKRDIFQLPPWVQLPPWIANKVELTDPEPEEGNTIIDSGRYEVHECVHRTFPGALYDAVETETGQRVVLKEARPNVEISGVWATQRLINEARVLRGLAHEGLTPSLLESLEADGHSFLVIDAIVNAENQLAPTLFHWWQSLHMADNADHSMRMRVADKAITCLKRLHKHKVAWIDFSPMNLLVTDADAIELRLIDAEYAIMDATREDFRRDCHALGRLLLWLLKPENDVLLNPNIALRDSDFEVLASTPAAYRRATLACMKKDTNINRISIEKSMSQQSLKDLPKYQSVQ